MMLDFIWGNCSVNELVLQQDSRNVNIVLQQGKSETFSVREEVRFLPDFKVQWLECKFY